MKRWLGLEKAEDGPVFTAARLKELPPEFLAGRAPALRRLSLLRALEREGT